MGAGLSEREMTVLRLKPEGKTRREIGEELSISMRTVQAHLSRIALKLRLRESEQTERELAIMRLVARGSTNQQIANELHISIHTVKAHLTNVALKLGAHNRGRLVYLFAQKRRCRNVATR